MQDANALLNECNVYLDKTASNVQVLEPSQVFLYDDLSYIPKKLWIDFNNSIALATKDLQKVSLYPKIMWGITNLAADLDPVDRENIRLRPEAAVLIDKRKIKENSNTYYILFTESLIRDIFIIFDSMLSLPTVLQSIGECGLEKPKLSLVKKPSDITRRNLAIELSITALEFAFLHEYYHIICGHLDNLFTTHKKLAMYAVGANKIETEPEANIHKVYELDADIMALVHMTHNIKNSKRIISLPFTEQTDTMYKFETMGFSLTVLFRCVELWRRDVRLIYDRNADHPHPDIRDSCLMAYIKNNASENTTQLKLFTDSYNHGRDNAIESINELDGTIPNFEVTTDLGQDIAIQEIDSLLSKLNEIRTHGVGPIDFRSRTRR